MTPSNGNNFRVTGHLCGEFTGPGEFPAQRPVTRSFHVFFDLHLNKPLSKQSWGWWFETLSRPFWRHCNGRKPITWTNDDPVHWRIHTSSGTPLLTWIIPAGISNYHETSNKTSTLVGNKTVEDSDVVSALLQIHLHSPLNTWLQLIGQRQLQDETRNNEVLGFGAPYIRGLTARPSISKLRWCQSSRCGNG